MKSTKKYQTITITGIDLEDENDCIFMIEVALMFYLLRRDDE